MGGDPAFDEEPETEIGSFFGSCKKQTSFPTKRGRWNWSAKRKGKPDLAAGCSVGFLRTTSKNVAAQSGQQTLFKIEQHFVQLRPHLAVPMFGPPVTKTVGVACR